MSKSTTTVILTLIILTTTISSRGQLHIHQTRNLSTLAQVWGLLKYSHPIVSSGKIDWDSVLLVSTQRLLISNTKTNLHQEIQRLLMAAGPKSLSTQKSTNSNLSDSAKSIQLRNLDHSWIAKTRLLTETQKKQLKALAENPYKGINYYSQPNPGNDSTVFTPNEKPYFQEKMPQAPYRLLGLFRFWNLINYYYPYKYAIGKPWEDTLHELIPVMVAANDTLSYHKALARMAASINDSHGGLWPQVFSTFSGKYRPSFDFRIIQNKVVITRPADHHNLQRGSVIEKIDGVTIKEKIRTYWDYIPASNPGGKLKNMHYILLNSHNRFTTISGHHADGTRFELKINLQERDLLKGYNNFFEMESKVTSKMLDDSIGYVFFSNVNARNLDSVMLPMMQTRAIIFDMRNYPTNGSGTYHIPRYLLTQPKIYSMLTRPDFSQLGAFIYEIANKGTNYATVGKIQPTSYKGKIILLVDERTQSAGEWACMTLQTAENVIVIGSQTAGADGNVTRTVLPGGYRINFSGLGIYYPDGKETQRIGIKVDIPSTYKISDIATGRDPLIAKALEYLNNNKKE